LLLFFSSRLRSAIDSDCLKRNYHNKRTTGPRHFKTLNELVVFMKELRMRIAVFVVSYLNFQKNWEPWLCSRTGSLIFFKLWFEILRPTLITMGVCSWF
jgi:hypothetical protein